MNTFAQKQAFLGREGDAWFWRNRAKLAQVTQDPVEATLSTIPLQPRAFLEIGCSNGWRVNRLAQAFRAPGYGIDPSEQAIAEGKSLYPDLTLLKGTAEKLPFPDATFDIVIYGFCLYLCDRGDLFQIAAEGDRVLADGGHVVIYDFFVSRPYARVYHHDPSLLSYKMDYSTLFLGHPAYTLQKRENFSHSAGAVESEDDMVAVIVMKKDVGHAFPLRADATGTV